jgi:hypothetical protein
VSFGLPELDELRDEERPVPSDRRVHFAMNVVMLAVIILACTIIMGG